MLMNQQSKNAYQIYTKRSIVHMPGMKCTNVCQLCCQDLQICRVLDRKKEA